MLVTLKCPHMYDITHVCVKGVIIICKDFTNSLYIFHYIYCMPFYHTTMGCHFLRRPDASVWRTASLP